MALSFAILSRTLHRSRKCIGSDRVILFGHSGLGDQISLATSFEAWADTGHQVLIPTKPKNLDRVSTLFSYLDNVVVLPLESDDPLNEESNVLRLSESLNVPVIDAGRSVYSWATECFPGLGVNGCLSAAALVQHRGLVSSRFRQNLLNQAQEPPPDRPYAFVDHHPGTPREIPESLLLGIESRELELVFNPRSAPLEQTALLMEMSQELHLVSSAPLCLALTANLGRGKRFRYRELDRDPLKLDYPHDWNELSLTPWGEVRQVDRIGETEAPSKRDRSSLGKAVLVRAARKRFLAASAAFDSAAIPVSTSPS
jgi:hypothetical protein